MQPLYLWLNKDRLRKVLNRYLVFALGALGIMACNEALEPNPAALGYEYFPLNSGDERVYEVTQIEHFIDLTSDTTIYQLREVVGESFTSGGEESYRIERYRRATETEGWQLDSVWSARVNTHQAVVVENNVPIIKLSFPVAENKRWDGNAMNTRLFDEFKMIEVGKDYELEGEKFSHSLTLIKEDLLDPCFLSSDNIHTEVYTNGIGLIHRIDIDRIYVSQDICADTGIIESGREVEYKLINHSLVE